jgi:hypothetical protein
MATPCLCDPDRVKILEFPQDYINFYEDVAIIQSQQTVEQPTGFTVCIRFKFVTFDFQSLINVKHNDFQFHLSANFDSGGLYGRFGGEYFEWNDAVEFSSYVWNLFCVSYNIEFQNFNIVVNNFTFQGPKVPINGTQLDFSYSLVKFPQKLYYTGMITDFNFWSRPLLSDDFHMLANGSCLSFYQINKPEYISWPEANIIIFGEGIKIKSTTYSDICSYVKERQVTIFWEPKLNFLDAFAECFSQKGDFPKVNSLANFEQVFNSANQTLRFGYNNTVWVPAKRVNGKWIQQTREMINAKFLVNDEIEKNENQKNFDCIFFHPVQRKFLLDTCLIGR